MTDSASPAKPVHTIVLDAGPILKNTPPLSTLLAQCEELLITPSVVSEIRDPDARQRVETLYLPFLKQRTPSPKSVSVLSEFARKTGDRAVLSKTDIEVLALAYEVECERNGGDWRLRSVPGQKQVNGKPPVKEEKAEEKGEEAKAEEAKGETEGETTQKEENKDEVAEVDAVAEDLKNANLEDKETSTQETEVQNAPAEVEAEESTPQDADAQEEEDDGDDSDGGWITPSNLKKRQARDEASSAAAAPEPKVMQVATMTTDFAVCFETYFNVHVPY